jgi:anti-sigma B factor antagonist
MVHDESDDGPIVGLDADELLHVTRRRLPGTVIVAAEGDIDLATSEDLAVAVRAELDSHPGIVVIDLTAVMFLASTGLAVLAEADQLAKESGQLLHVVVGDRHPVVVRSLVASGMANRLTLFRDLGEALTAI